MRTKAAVAVLRMLLAVTLLYAAIGKATEIENLRASLRASELVPLWAVSLLPFALIGLEAIIGLLLLGPTKLSAMSANACRFLFSFFVGYHLWRAVQKIQVPCDCFGPLLRLTPIPGAALALVLALASTFLVELTDIRPSL